MSKDTINELFEYKGGQLFWKKHTYPNRVGTPVVRKVKKKYSTVIIGNKSYYLHRIIYALHTGDWPATVDHINGNTRDNRIENLRAATYKQNVANTKDIAGGYFCKRRKKWYCEIAVGRKKEYVGLFNSKEEMRAAFIKKHLDMHGEFSYFYEAR